MRKPTIAVIGAGRAARAIVAAARRSGVRRLSPARADIVILAVSDRAIAEVARELAASQAKGRTTPTALHLSGAMGAAALEPLRALGATVGVVHPLTVFGEKVSPAPGSFRLEGSKRFRNTARRLVAALWPDARELRASAPLEDAERARYHAAASLVANDLVALLDGGVGLLASIGIRRSAADRGLSRLAADALAAVSQAGTRRGLTGPVVRGDVDTVRRHLEALREVDPEIAEIHRLLSLRLVRIALEAKRIRTPQAAALRRVLRKAPGGPRRTRGV